MNLPAYLIPAADGIPWLTLLLLTPLIGIALIGLAALLKLDDTTVRRAVLAWSLLPIGLALQVAARFDGAATADGQAAVQFVERIPWIRAVRVDYFLGVDGLSIALVLLTALMTPLAVIAAVRITAHLKSFLALLLLLEAAMLGYFMALDFFFFFIFWEFSLVPAFLLIQNWGRSERRPAAFTFFVYTMAGSIGLLLLFQLLYLALRQAGLPTFDLVLLGRLGQGLPVEGVDGDLSLILFRYLEEIGVTAALGRFPLLYTSIAMWAIFIAFGIKLAVWPMHTWLPAAYGEAPTAASILLAAVMSKMGAYGMLRILLPLVPQAVSYFAPVLATLAVIGILAGAYGALKYVGGDIKRMIGYTSINHMGYVMLGVASAAAAGNVDAAARSAAINGVLVQLVAHGLSTGVLFYLADRLEARSGQWTVAGLGGLRGDAPAFAGIFGLALFANLGLPGLAGFVGEFFIFRGAWATLPVMAAAATLGLIVTALALLQLYRAIFLGPVGPRATGLADLSQAERWAALPFLLVSLVIGLYPAPLMLLGHAAATHLTAVFVRIFA